MINKQVQEFYDSIAVEYDTLSLDRIGNLLSKRSNK